MTTNAERVLRESLELLSRRDFYGWMETWTEDSELHIAPEMPDATTHRGRDEIRAWAENTAKLMDRWSWTLGDVLSRQDDLLVARFRLTGQGAESGIATETDIFYALRLRDGRIARAQAFFSEAEAVGAAAAGA